jgi:hypothetical protein
MLQIARHDVCAPGSLSLSLSLAAMLDSFCLVRLSQEALLMQCKSDDHEHWGAPLLDVAQWQQKDRVQRATRFSQAGALFWALVDGASDTVDSLSDARLEADRDLLYCHCKTLRFDCAVRRRSGDVERGFSYHVSSAAGLPSARTGGLLPHARGRAVGTAAQRAALRALLGRGAVVLRQARLEVSPVQDGHAVRRPPSQQPRQCCNGQRLYWEWCGAGAHVSRRRTG